MQLHVKYWLDVLPGGFRGVRIKCCEKNNSVISGIGSIVIFNAQTFRYNNCGRNAYLNVYR